MPKPIVEQASSAVAFPWDGLKNRLLSQPCFKKDGTISALRLVPLKPLEGPALRTYSTKDFVITSDNEAKVFRVVPRPPVAPNPKLQELSAPFLKRSF